MWKMPLQMWNFPIFFFDGFPYLFSADCLMSEWTAWCNGCSATCGTGIEQRSRKRFVVPWSSGNKITCGHKTIACMTGSPDCNLGLLCSDGSPILHIEGNNFECFSENQIQREPCILPPCSHGNFFYIDKSKVQCLFSWSDKFWKTTNGQQRPEQTSKDKPTQAKTSKEKQWQAKTSKDKQRQTKKSKDKQRPVVLTIPYYNVKLS